ncbi:MAG: metallophosphoesterase family protein [Thermoleophilia bacterium]
MRTLVISDIHGNIDALQAIDEQYDNIVCTGDIVDYGPNPRECIEFLRERNVIRARGNHDHAVAFCQDCQTPKGPLRRLSLASREYTEKVLSDGEKSWLGEAETSVQTGHDGLRIFAVHGAPSNHMYKYLLPQTSDEVLAKEVASVDADIIVIGHTHQPFIKRFDGKVLVNAGSVGQPRDGIAKACYAIIEDGAVEIRRAEYDVAAVVAKTRAIPIDKSLRERLAYLIENAHV